MDITKTPAGMPKMAGIPNKMKHSRKTRIIPANMDGMTMGSVTVNNIFILLAPNIVAAFSKEESILSRDETIEKKVNGYKNNEETNTIPENVKMLSTKSIPKTSFSSIFSFPARGPSKIIQAIAPMKLGLAKVRTENVRINFRKGIFVRETPKAIGTAITVVKMTV